MADAKKCDICGTFYDGYERKFQTYFKGESYYCYINPFFIFDEFGSDTNKYPDMCKDCFKELMSKIMGEIEKI